jgi:hypothetical protein
MSPENIEGIEPLVQENIDSTFKLLSPLRISENEKVFNRDIRKRDFESDEEIVIYSLLSSLGYDVIPEYLQFESFENDLRYSEQAKALLNFWEANTVDDVLSVIETEDITESKHFYTSILEHIDKIYRKPNDDNIHAEIISLAIVPNLRRGTYKKVKGLIDIGFPAKYSLKIVLNN